LKLQPRDARNGFPTQPYNQLADVLRKQGREDDARRVLIQKEWDALDGASSGPFSWGRNRLYWATVGYGYRPWRAGFWVAGFVLIGACLFKFGYKNGIIRPSKPEGFLGDGQIAPDYPMFNSFVYAFETLTPLVDLHHAEYWTINPKKGGRVKWLPIDLTSGQLLRGYFWAHTVIGWVLAAALGAGLAGLLRGS
jgi:hypothetical protein